MNGYYGRVYLAGPITGCSYKGCNEWRESVRDELLDTGILAYSPMRKKDYLKTLNVIPSQVKIVSPMVTDVGITTRDRFDCTHADVILMNLLGAKRVSIGTMIEVGWADANRVPIVLVMEEGNPHEHPMISRIANFKVVTLPEAVDVVKAILIP